MGYFRQLPKNMMTRLERVTGQSNIVRLRIYADNHSAPQHTNKSHLHSNSYHPPITHGLGFILGRSAFSVGTGHPPLAPWMAMVFPSTSRPPAAWSAASSFADTSRRSTDEKDSSRRIRAYAGQVRVAILPFVVFYAKKKKCRPHATSL